MSRIPTRRRVVVFDLGGVLLEWDPRHLYRKLSAGDDAAMEEFLATVCTPGARKSQQSHVELPCESHRRFSLFGWSAIRFADVLPCESYALESEPGSSCFICPVRWRRP